MEEVCISLDCELLDIFMAVMWECQNTKNCFIFGKMNTNLGVLRLGTIAFVRSFCEAQEREGLPSVVIHLELWRPPAHGCMKLNYDGGNMGETTWGRGFVLRNDLGDIELAGANHGPWFAASRVKEARSCLFGLKCALEIGVCNIVVEGDCHVLF